MGEFVLRLVACEKKSKHDPQWKSSVTAPSHVQRERVRRVLKSQKFQHIGANVASGLRKVCREVSLNGGRASHG